MATIQELGKKAKGAKAGNTQGKDAYSVKSAIQWALAQEYGEIERGKALKAIAQRAVSDALAGDKDARNWIADRTEGKAATVITGDPEKPLRMFGSISWNVAMS
jgi:hypothetical protein